jgi:23S rRNA pseudouridine1911/1915/1917 synthase
MPSDFELLYENGPCLAVCKPPGVLTQAPPGIDSLEVRVKTHFQTRDGQAEQYLGVPHRLDRPASGVLVLARDLRTTRKLGEQFEKRKVQKLYWALVSGTLPAATGTWEDYLYKIPGLPRAEVVDAGHPQGRRALLHYRVLATAAWGTWLEIELETGRTHQIRVQAASRGYPLLGDSQYGSTVAFGPQYEDARLQAIALHARRLTFRDPCSREMVTVDAPVADYWPELTAN